MKRSSGILMHISSLPNPFGIGSLGKCAYDFADYARECGFSHWQVLPLNPTGFGDSPYQPFSTFAGNPWFIDLGKLVEMGLLKREELPKFAKGPVNYGAQYVKKRRILELAHRRAGFLEGEIQAFSDRHFAEWLGDYALFMSIKEDRGGSWRDWPVPVRDRMDPHMFIISERYMQDMHYWIFVQYLFFRQLGELREHLKKIGLGLIGDLPIYVAMDSADTWANRPIFQFHGNIPAAVAGVPPDYFSPDGQLWGNPLYRWSALKKRGYDWWLRRVRGAAEMFDVIRLDHFRGFESYFSVPFGDENARRGRWLKGPGLPFVEKLRETGIPFIAEDLGLITGEVRRLREASGFPGMNVVQFGFDEKNSPHLPHNHGKNSVSYLGTNDNDTLLGWYAGLPSEKREAVRGYFGPGPLRETAFRSLFASPADLVIVTLQDVLGLKGRMNTPATSSGNWTFRLPDDSYRAETGRMRTLNRTFCRD